MSTRRRLGAVLTGWMPWPLFVALLYIFLIFVWFPLVVLTSPVWLLYGFIRLAVTWYVLPRQGKGFLVITNGEGNFGPWLSQLLAEIEGRSIFLDYATRARWNSRSLPVWLFRAYGPKPKPSSWMPQCLPAIVIFRRFHVPKSFLFGSLCREPAERLEALRSALARNSS